MRHLKLTLTLSLCLILIATSVTGAFARGQMAFGQMAQLCIGGEAVTIVLDARGNPVDAAHPCPECVAVAAGLPPASPEFTRPAARWTRIADPTRASVAGQIALQATARGPPVLI